jgi:dihydroneopterin aldolase
MDCVFIEKLRVDCIIGIYEEEKKNPQAVIVDCDIYYRNRGAGQSDDYRLVIDYALVCRDITDLLQSSRFELVETAAERICEMILGRYGAEKIRIKISKPEAVPEAAAVGVIIERSL